MRARVCDGGLLPKSIKFQI